MMGSFASSPSIQFAGENELEMDKGEGNDVVISMEVPTKSPKSFLCKVPKMFRKMNNETAYTPQFISIGPFHHGQPDLMDAEQYKDGALRKYLSRKRMKFEEAMSLAYSWDEKARSCYGYHIDMNKHDFAKMMLLDGCFILEFTMKSTTNYRWSLFSQSEVERDLTMFENQLPFFVLQQLYHKSSNPQNKNEEDPRKQLYGDKTLMEWMEMLFTATTATYMLPSDVSPTKVRHLVDLLTFYYNPSPETDEYYKFIENEEGYSFPYKAPTITKLCEAGIKVRRAEEAQSMMDFSFKNGVLKIPPFTIHTNFEIQFRNLIVSEILSDDVKGEKYLFHYLLLLDDLIKTENDVSILVKEEIIINETDDSDEQVSKIIHSLHLMAPTIRLKSYFNYMSGDLNDYCNRPMASIHRSMALLRRDYFNSPWASISCLAAIFLLILDCLQTLFSAPSFFLKK